MTLPVLYAKTSEDGGKGASPSNAFEYQRSIRRLEGFRACRRSQLMKISKNFRASDSASNRKEMFLQELKQEDMDRSCCARPSAARRWRRR